MLPFSYRAVVPAAAGTTQHDIQRAAPIITVVLVLYIVVISAENNCEFIDKQTTICALLLSSLLIVITTIILPLHFKPTNSPQTSISRQNKILRKNEYPPKNSVRINPLLHPYLICILP
jgi:hypothetical protein